MQDMIGQNHVYLPPNRERVKVASSQPRRKALGWRCRPYQILGAYERRNRQSTDIKPEAIRILSVDDHPLLREGVRALIDTQTDMRLVAEASNGREAIERFRSHRPDVTLMDLKMPEMDGMDALIAIRSEFRDARIIVLTAYAGDALCLRSLKAGAQAYMLKDNARTDLLDTIRAVRAGKKFIQSEVAAELASHATDDALSEREIEVLSLIAAGNSNKLIADQLIISEDSVKGHVRHVLAKLGANHRTHAVTVGLKRGIIDFWFESKHRIHSGGIPCD